MGDIKLFSLKAQGVTELAGHSVQIERSLQILFEQNLEAFLGVRFLASEHSTGAVHGGRIDTLGIDENGCPVIIEYKRAINENVVSQGLFYLDWLLDHKKDFQWLVLEKLGAEVAKSVDWSAPRLLCIAGDFTRYDEHAVKQISRNIELLRYRKFGDEMLMIELVHAPKVVRSSPVISVATAPRAKEQREIEAQDALSIDPGNDADPTEDRYLSQRVAFRIAQAPALIKDVYGALDAFLTGLGDDVQTNEMKFYVAYKRIKNFATVQVQNKHVVAFIKVDPESIVLEPGFTRDVRKIGHFGTGNLEVVMKSMEDFARAQPLLQRSYEMA